MIAASTTHAAAAALLLHEQYVPRYMHREVFGRGIPIDGKVRPRFANPRKKPYGGHDPRTGARRPHRLNGGRLLRHSHGQQPHFLINIAHDPRRRLVAGDGLVDLAGALELRPLRGQLLDLLDDAEAAGGPAPLTISDAEELLKARPGTASAAALEQRVRARPADPAATALRLALLALEPYTNRFWPVRRALERACRIEWIPRLEHELVVDIDADKRRPEAANTAMQMAWAIAYELLVPEGFTTFVEPSRNGVGAYVRFRVSRDSDPQTFNALLGRLTRWLQIRYGDKTSGAPAWVDKVAGRLAYWSPNPQFDQELYYTQPQRARMSLGERYQWCRRHHGQPSKVYPTLPVIWRYDLRLERHVLSCGQQITLPLHKLGADADGGLRRLEAFEQYFHDPALCSEAYLREHVRDVPEPPAPVEGGDAAGDSRAPLADGSSQRVVAVSWRPPACGGTPETIEHLLDLYGRGRDIQIFLDESAEQHQRYGAAARLVLRHLGPPDLQRVVDEVLRLVELPFGPATGERHPERVRHVERCVGHWAASFRPGKRRGTGALEHRPPTQEELHWALAVVRRRIPQSMIDAALMEKPEAFISHHALAAALAHAVVAMHTGWQRTDVSALGVRRALVAAGCPVRRAKVSARVAMQLLTAPQARLLVRVREAYSASATRQGRCRGYMLHESCPLAKWIGDVAGAAGVLVWHVSGTTGRRTRRQPRPFQLVKPLGAPCQTLERALVGTGARQLARSGRRMSCRYEPADAAIVLSTLAAHPCSQPPMPLPRIHTDKYEGTPRSGFSGRDTARGPPGGAAGAGVEPRGGGSIVDSLSCSRGGWLFVRALWGSSG